MRQAYREVMDHIAVTQEMRERVLHHIRAMDLPAAKARARMIWTRRLAAAACFAVLAVGAVALPRINTPSQEQNPPGVEHGVWNRTQTASLEELSQVVGFAVEGLESLPFPVMETSYTAYGKEMAEVTYTGETQSLVYRKTAGSTDPSGDYTAYSHVLVLELETGIVTLKGEEESYCLALWEDGTYSYSARASEGYSQDQWAQMLEPAE